MDRPQVLVVDDRPSVLALMASVLGEAYQVTTAPDCTSALSLVASRPFQAVLTDVRMADGTGFEVLRAARRHARATAVVMMTAYANVPDAVLAIKLGAYDYVAKPIDADEIALVVARAVEHVVGGARPDALLAPRDEADAFESAVHPEVRVGFHSAVEQARERASREYLERLLRLFRGNVTQAARRAGMRRESLHRVMRRYGIKVEPAEPSDDGDAGRGGPAASAG